MSPARSGAAGSGAAGSGAAGSGAAASGAARSGAAGSGAAGSGVARSGAVRAGAVRSTRQGAAVQSLLAESASFRSAQDLHAELRRRGDSVGLTTVYRHLQVLADAGAVDVLHLPEGETVYRLCGRGDHHHHLVCRGCGLTVEIDGREVERWTQHVADSEGFIDIDHTVEIFGTCAACAAR